jgi:hypothetical protein
MFIGQHKERHNETSTANTEQPGKEANPASPKNKDQELSRYQVHCAFMLAAAELADSLLKIAAHVHLSLWVLQRG